MIETKFANLKLVSSENDINELVRFPAEHSNFLDDLSLLEEKNDLYSRGEDEWTSISMPSHTKKLIKEFFQISGKTLDVGCGIGIDSIILQGMGFKLTSIDKAYEAIKYNVKKNEDVNWIKGDFLIHNFLEKFDNVYDKGAYHNIIIKEEKIKFINTIAKNLKKGGRWLNISGCDDSDNGQKRFGRINLSEFLSLAESDFKVLSITRQSYGEIKASYSFEAWHTILEKK